MLTQQDILNIQGYIESKGYPETISLVELYATVELSKDARQSVVQEYIKTSFPKITVNL